MTFFADRQKAVFYGATGMDQGAASRPLLRAAVGVVATLLLFASVALAAVPGAEEDGFLLIATALAGLGLWHVSLAERAPRLSVLLRDGVAITLLLLVRSETYQIWQLPVAWSDIFRLTPEGTAASLVLYFIGALATLVRARRALVLREAICLIAVPLLFNLAFALGAANLMAEIGAALTAASVPEPLQVGLGRALALFVLNEAIVGALGFVIRARPARDIRLHGALALAALVAAATPMIADLPQQGIVAGGAATMVLAVVAAAASQAGLWAIVFLSTGLVLDALSGKPPSFAAVWAHWQKGLVKGGVFGGLFMFILLAGASLVHDDAIAVWVIGHPLIAAAGFGALLYPLAVTIVASADETPPFFLRLAGAYRNARIYLRGVVVGLGVVLIVVAGLPGAGGGTRFLCAFLVGAAAYSGVDFLCDAAAVLRQRRRSLPSWRLYCIGTLLGGVVGGALGWYFDANQIAVVTTKFWAYVELSYAATGRPTNPYVIYALFSKWGMVDLGPVGGGVRLFYNESLSGVINWSLAAPLFSINYFLLAALIERSFRPLREMLSVKGMQGLVEQTVRVLRWGLWMAPVIYSFLRMSSAPSWYNQDGAVRTIAATIVDLTRPGAFNAWSLAVFTGLLAYDWLRILIWFDHMGLRVATLVNLSFLGGDKADEAAARFAGHAARTHIIPEAIRRFLTWAPLLIPFYIPRNAEWDQAWSAAEKIRATVPPMAPPVDNLITTYVVAGAAAALAGGAIAWRMRARAAGRGEPKGFVLSNGAIGVALRPDGCGYTYLHSIARTTRPLDITRRPSDPLEFKGTFFYLGDADTKQVWSIAREPMRRTGDDYQASQPRPDRIEIAHTLEDVRCELEVTLDERQAVEFRRIRLNEASGKARRLVLTSYQELVLNERDVYLRDPVFNAMHVETWFVQTLPAIFARNRLLRDHARSEKERRMSHQVCFHAVRIDAGTAHVVGYEDSRTRFLGEGTLGAPAGIEPGRARDPADEGILSTFDPAASLTIAVDLAAHGSCELVFITGHARDESAAADILARHLRREPAVGGDVVALPLTRRALEPLAPPAAEAFPYAFTHAGRRLELTEATPRPWAHVLGNPAGQGMVVSNEGALFSFAGNARANGLTRWPFDPARAEELTGQDIYVVDLATGRADTPGFLPFRRSDAAHEVVYGLGSATFRKRDEETELELTVGVAPDHPADMRLLTIRNRSDREREFRVVGYFDMILSERSQDSAGKMVTAEDEATGVMLFNNPSNDFWSGWAFVATSLAADCRETVRTRFFGEPERGFTNPVMVETGAPDPSRTDDGRRVAAFAGTVTVPASGEAQVAIVLGQAPTRAEAIETALLFRDSAKVAACLAGQEAAWLGRGKQVEVETNNPEFDRLVNYWLPYQLCVAHLWGRVGPDQRGGAYGYRDQLQSVLGLLIQEPAAARRTILYHAGQQFTDGRTLKWWHRVTNGETGIGLRSLASDTHLWLPYVTARYIEALGDHAILDEKIAYLDGPRARRGTGGDVIVPRRSLEIDDLYGHCRRAIDLALTQLGAHRLPLSGAGDWNDGIDVAGLDGRGESVWLACFLVDVLTGFIPLAERRKDAVATKYRRAADSLRRALDVAWRDGRYIIGFDDAGLAFQQASVMTAAWPVLSGAVGFERGRAALEGGLARLEWPDRVLLIDPPFDETSVPYPGRIADYPPGVRENGAQYTHGATWVVDAYLRLAEMAREANDPEVARQMSARAFSIWKKISPLDKCEGDALPIYGLAPHQQPADIYDGEGYPGRGGWSWYTGAAARMLTAAYSLLGIKLVAGRVVVADDLFQPKGELQVRSLKIGGETFTAPRH